MQNYETLSEALQTRIALEAKEGSYQNFRFNETEILRRKDEAKGKPFEQN